jgi:hypothetical protein
MCTGSGSGHCWDAGGMVLWWTDEARRLTKDKERETKQYCANVSFLPGACGICS